MAATIIGGDDVEALRRRDVPFESRDEMAEMLEDFYMHLRELCEQYHIAHMYSVIKVGYKYKDENGQDAVEGGMMVSMIGDTSRALDFAAFGYGFEKSSHDERIKRMLDNGADIAKQPIVSNEDDVDARSSTKS